MAEDQELVVGAAGEITVPLSQTMSVPDDNRPEFQGQGIEDDLTPSPLERAQRERSFDKQIAQKGGFAPKKFWSDKIKRTFSELAPRQQKAWLEATNYTERYYDKLAKELKGQYAILDKVAEVLAPIAPEILKINTIPGYVNALVEGDKMLAKDPIGYIFEIMRSRNIYFTDLQNYVPQYAENKKIEQANAPIINKIEALENKVQQLGAPSATTRTGVTEEVEDEAVDALIDRLDTFYTQTDSGGRLLYPYAADVMEDILDYIQAGGRDLIDAYDYAVAQNEIEPNIPGTRGKGAYSESPVSDDPSYPQISDRNEEKASLYRLAEELSDRYRGA
jgi:hypothetical protein